VQLIGQPGKGPPRTTIQLFVARTWTNELHRLELETYAELLSLDWEALVGGDGVRPIGEASGAIGPGERTSWVSPADGPLFVCTNGRRDLCCALHGNVVFARARSRLGSAAWQTTHLGGHRFAATAVRLPGGVVYGRLTPDTLDVVLDVEATGGVALDHLRGRSMWPRPAQAAEYYLRRSQPDLPDIRLDRVEGPPGGPWQIEFLDREGSSRVVSLTERLSDFAVLKSTGDPGPVQVPQFELLSTSG
jgi:hypothetical protein